MCATAFPLPFTAPLLFIVLSQFKYMGNYLITHGLALKLVAQGVTNVIKRPFFLLLYQLNRLLRNETKMFA